MIHYETFESSSEDEMSKGIFESQALSFQNKDKQISSTEKEQKRLERLRRKERKLNEKLRVKREEERQNRKRQRMKLRLQDLNKEKIVDELQDADDVLNFKDSDRESVLSYFVKNGYSNDFAALDTPTRLLNKSNDFLPLQYDEKLKKAIEEMDKQNEIEL